MENDLMPEDDWLKPQPIYTDAAGVQHVLVRAAKPHTLQEAVEIILQVFGGDEDFFLWVNSKHRMGLHFGLGMWIRNQWAYGDSSPLYQRAINLDPDNFRRWY